MKKILCPTDFSEVANNAIAYAAKLAHATNSSLTLFNVQSLFDLAPVEIVTGRDRTINRAVQSLESLSLQVSKVFKISCYAEIESSSRKLSQVINEKATNFDLVVMGSNGPDDLYQFFNGSNAYNALLKTKTPLLLIPADYMYSEIESVVYAFDYLRERNLSFEGLTPFIKALNCDLKVLQVMEEAYGKEVEDDLAELQFIIKSTHDDVDYKFDTVRSSEISEGINDYILNNRIDVLALCSVHRSVMQRLFHKSVIQRVTSVCTYPIYIFHQK